MDNGHIFKVMKYVNELSHCVIFSEEGSETFVIKRSGHSRRIAKQLKRDSKKEKEEKLKENDPKKQEVRLIICNFSKH